MISHEWFADLVLLFIIAVSRALHKAVSQSRPNWMHFTARSRIDSDNWGSESDGWIVSVKLWKDFFYLDSSSIKRFFFVDFIVVCSFMSLMFYPFIYLLVCMYTCDDDQIYTTNKETRASRPIVVAVSVRRDSCSLRVSRRPLASRTADSSRLLPPHSLPLPSPIFPTNSRHIPHLE